MEILLAYKSHAGGAKDPYTSLLPVGLGYINAVLRGKGHKSRVANFSSMNWREIAGCIAATPPAILGVSQFTHNRFDSHRLARLAKEINPSCFVVFGGPHATHRFQEVLSLHDAVDAVVLGEGEETFSELAGTLARNGAKGFDAVRGIAYRKAGSIAVTPPRVPLEDLDSLPLPAACFDDAVGVDVHRQLEFLITSRGCPASCRFCSSPRFWGKGVRFRSPKSIVDEIKFIRDRYGLIYFSIRDDTFTADRGRVLEFCRLLLQEKVYILWNCQSRVNAVDEEMLFRMKQAGCECIQFGVESGSVKVLRALGKGITPDQVRKAALCTRRAGIHLSVYLMTGVPGETEADVQETLALLEVAKASDGQVSPLAYYPGTFLFDKGVTTGAIGRDVFESDKRDAFYVRNDPFVTQSVKAILAKLQHVADLSRFTPADFLAQKKALGYCHATNIMAGEMYEAAANWRKAEAEYREIIAREPENPWGWLLIGELYAGKGDIMAARTAFERLSSLVPGHAPAFANLGDLSLIEGDNVSARKYYRHAISLDPYEQTALEGIQGVKE
ncbi:MAG TPA: radical SAM protein [Geobacteraceae bacterium]|nr:radical SAM protein [Geobacteraceae bacterium]